MPVFVHAYTMRLQHGGIVVDVNHQAGQKIAFAMHQTIGVVILPRKSRALTEPVRKREALFPEIIRQMVREKLQDPDSNRANLPMSYAQCLAFAALHYH